MSVRSSKLVAELVDRVSGPASAIEKSLKNVGTAGRKNIGADDKANPLGARGSAAVIDRVRRLDRETSNFAKRYEISATKSGRAWSTSLAATSNAMALHARTLEATGRSYDNAARKAQTYYRASTAASGAMYSLDRLAQRRAARLSDPSTPLPPNANDSARNAARNRPRASDWVAQEAARRAAERAGGGDGDGRIRPGVGGAIGGGGTAAAAWKLMASSADEERDMRQTAVSAGAAESEINPAIARLKALQQKWATPYKEIKEDFDELIVMGRTWAQALRDIEGLTIARRAYGAGFGRLQTLVGENFGMTSPEQQQRAMQLISGAGRSGRFEVRHFTSRFGKLAPMFKSAGFRSEAGLTYSAALMQILADRFGTADQAAVGMENLLGEFISPVAKKRAAKLGLDYDKIMSTAEKEGRNGFQEILAELYKRTGGDERKLGEFFRNKNSLQAISALVTNYSKIAEKIAEIERNAQTAMTDDAARFVNDSKAKMDGLQNAIKDAGGIIGEFLSEHLTPFVERITQGVRVATGKAGSDKEQLEFRRRQYETGGPVTRWMASRGITRLEKHLGKNRDFSLANTGNGFSTTGIPVANGGAFFPNPDVAKRATEALQKGLQKNGSPLMHRGGVVTGPSLFPGGFSPDPIANTPYAAPGATMPSNPPLPPVRPKFESKELDGASNVFDLIRDQVEELNNKSVSPKVETGPLERALGLVRQLLSDLNQVEAGTARVANAAGNNVSRQVRAAMVDYGMETSG